MPLKNITNTMQVAPPRGKVTRAPKRAREEVEEVRMPKKVLNLDFELTANEMADIKDTIYAGYPQKRKMFKWEKCPKFILDPLIERMMRMAKATKDDVFLDIGCGIGNVCQSVATRVGCDTVGIEITKENYAIAQGTAEDFHNYRVQTQLPTPKTEFLLGDLRDHLPDLYDRATIVWCANLLFPLQLDIFMIYAVRRFKPGTRIFVMKDTVLHTHPTHPLQAEGCKYFDFVDFKWGPGDVEWTNRPGNLYMYIRNNNIVEDTDSEEE